MVQKIKTCLFLSICFILLFSGVALSDEPKVEKKNDPADKVQIEKMLKPKPKPFSPWTKKEYSMQVIRPNPDIDNKIVKNNFDPNIDYNLRIIDPYTGIKITGNKRPGVGSFQNMFLPRGKRH